ncbi:MAG: GNAT family N-acetyltransferase [Acidimicrobiales bacterium]
MIEVRRVRPEEYVDAGDVTASAWGPGGSPDDESWLSFRARVADVVGRDVVAVVFIATENDCILGSVTLEMDDRIEDPESLPPLAHDEAHVRVLGVAPAARRRGVGRILMCHCADVARGRGKTRLTLNTSVKNSTAQAFYEAIGFVRLHNLELEDGSQLRSYELNLR